MLTSEACPIHVHVMYTSYAHVTKCHPDTKYKQSPKQTVLNKILMNNGTPYETLCDAYIKRREFHYAAEFGVGNIKD